MLLVMMYSLVSFAQTGTLFNVTLSNLTLNITTNIPNHNYTSAGIKLNTSNYSLANPGSECVPHQNGYCLFSVNNVSSKTITITGNSGVLSLTLCLNGISAVSCQTSTFSVTAGPKNAYITNNANGTVLICPIQSNGAFGHCNDSGNTFSSPIGIRFNSSGTIAYIVNNLGGGAAAVSLCPVNTDGTFGNCTGSGSTGTAFILPFDIALNSADTIAYVTNVSLAVVPVLACPINANGTLGSCSTAGATAGQIPRPRGIVLNRSGSRAYVVSYFTSDVILCNVNTNGTFGSCGSAGNTGSGSFSSPSGITLNADETKAYVANSGNNTISVCPINSNGTFGACVYSGNSGTAFSNPVFVALNSTKALAYVTNVLSNSVLMCPLNENGGFGACLDSGNSGSAFNGPAGIALL